MALVVVFICSTLVLDKWLLKRQHKKTTQLINYKENKFKGHYIKRLRVFHKHIEKLETEKKDLLDYINKCEKNIKKLQKNRPE